MSTNTYFRYTAPHNCDSVEINDRRDLIFVGMYEYEESSSSRGGGFLIMNPKTGKIENTIVTTEYGCLDAKWTSNSDLVIACSDGNIRTYSNDTQIVSCALVVDSSNSNNSTAKILMALDVQNTLCAVISAKGQVSLLEIESLASPLMSWEAHSPVIESWTCALSPTANVLVTGSDDCCLKFWDTKSSDLIFSNSKSHRMGTTAIKFLNDNELLSGSYDDRIRRFDLRNLSEPIMEQKSIGGIWRLKPENDKLFVAACYGGCQILSLNDLLPIITYAEHKSMAYGIAPIDAKTAVSCSFYDKQVLCWEF